MKRFLRPTASAANSGGASSHDIDASGGSGGQSSSSLVPEPGGAVAQSNSSCAPEPGAEPGSSGGGGLPGDEACVDLEVSSTSSGETLEAGAPPEGLDITWAQAPQTWHLARWCVERAHSVCRAMAKILATSDFKT